MLKKMLLAGVFALMISAGAFAEDLVFVTINFYAESEVTPVKEFPEGIVMKPKIRFNNRKLPGFAHPMQIEIDKVQTLDQSFTVKGEGKVQLSVNCGTMVNGKQVGAPTIKCTEFVLNGKPTKKVPFVFKKWVTAADPILVKDGDTITIKATFEKVE